LTPINTGSDPTWAGKQKYEVLVAVLAYTPELRVKFENEMAEQLKKEGVNAIPSFTVMPSVTALNGETFSRFLEAGPSLAVLFVQAKDVQKQQTSSKTEEPNAFSSLFGGGEWDTTFVAMMETALYVHGQSAAVWWNRVRMEASEKKVDDVVERYVLNTVKAMKQGGAISRLK